MSRLTSLRVLTATALAATTLGVLSPAAHAAVDSCHPEVRSGSNLARTICFRGFGKYRVAARCDSATYPYSITIYGPWRSRNSGTEYPEASVVYGDRYACHISKAWTSTLS